MSCPAQNSMGADSNSPTEAATRSSVRVAPRPINAALSTSLRSLLVGRASGLGGESFFNGGQPARANRLVQRIRRDPRGLRYLRHAAAFLQQGLHALRPLALQHRPRSRSRLREERFWSLIPQQLQIALHGWQRHAKGVDDIYLPRRAHVNELTREQPKAAKISFVMLKDGQRAIDVHYPLVLTLVADSIGDAFCSCRENGQL